MPPAALAVCSYPGCTVLVKSGRCEHHQIKRQSHYDPEKHRFYNTSRWKRLRATQLSNEPWCKECRSINEWTPAEDVDHVVPHNGNPKLFFDPTNLQSLCHACHTIKTNQERGEGGGKSLEPGRQTAQMASDFSVYKIGE